MLDMAKKEYLPAITKYQSDLAEAINQKKAASSKALCRYELDVLEKLDAFSKKVYETSIKLEDAIIKSKDVEGYDKARYICDYIKELMSELREAVDSAEAICSEKSWPLPSYNELLFSI